MSSTINRDKVLASFYQYGVACNIRLVNGSSSAGVTGAESVPDITLQGTSDPVSFYVETGSGLRVMVVERVYDDVTYEQKPCFITIYDPKDWSIKVARANYKYKDGTDLLNVYSAVTSIGAVGLGYIYGADYSGTNVANPQGRIFMMEYTKTGSVETLTIKTHYQFTPTTKARAYSVGTVLVAEGTNNYVFAIAQQYTTTGSGYDPGDYDYGDSILAKLDYKTLEEVATTAVAPNAFSIQTSGIANDSDLYITSIGGAQWYGDGSGGIKWNVGSRIQMVKAADMTVKDLVRPANADEAGDYPDDCFDIRAVAFCDDAAKTTYILTGSYAADYKLTGRLWKTTLADLKGADDDLISSIASSGYPTVTVNAKGALWVLLPCDGATVWGFAEATSDGYAGLGIYNANRRVGELKSAKELSTLGAPSFSQLAVVLAPEATRGVGAAAPASIASARGYVHPVFASGAGLKPEERAKFIKAHFGK